MIVHQVFAQIYEGEIKNIIVCDNYELANWLTRSSYGNESLAIDCLYYPCTVGDKYHENKFYRVQEDGKEVELLALPSEEQEIQNMKKSNIELYEYQIELDYLISCRDLAINGGEL